MSMPGLYDSLVLGPWTLRNRVLMAPCTRSRAGPGLAPTAMNARYYAQRASAGLIISEAAAISPRAVGYPRTPGIWTAQQVAGWRLVTDAVHSAGGRIYCQLWHVGRVSHPDFQPSGGLPVAPSAINPGGEARLEQASKPRVTPRALEIGEIAEVIGEYRHAARCALEAGFDGVELHGANGYLPDQFLRDSSNRRTDAYGGSVARRARFMLEAAGALCEVWGPARVGVRLSPSGNSAGMMDSTPRETFGYVLRELSRMRVGYAHVMERFATRVNPDPPGEAIPVREFRPMFDGVLIANSAFSRERAEETVSEGWADAVSFGRLFIANPDLPERFAAMSRGETVPMNTPDEATFYSVGERGYTDYPRWRV